MPSREEDIAFLEEQLRNLQQLYALILAGRFPGRILEFLTPKQSEGWSERQRSLRSAVWTGILRVTVIAPDTMTLLRSRSVAQPTGALPKRDDVTQAHSHWVTACFARYRKQWRRRGVE